eukprot:jgi/Mesen1/3293/ME000191S02435
MNSGEFQKPKEQIPSASAISIDMAPAVSITAIREAPTGQAWQWASQAPSLMSTPAPVFGKSRGSSAAPAPAQALQTLAPRQLEEEEEGVAPGQALGPPRPPPPSLPSKEMAGALLLTAARTSTSAIVPPLSRYSHLQRRRLLLLLLRLQR